MLVPVFDLNIAFHFYLMLWITMATAFNVAAGFSGYMPFGFVAFYGVGAFTTAILVKSLGFPVLLALPFSGVAGVVLGLLFAPTLRLSGIYFAIVSLALAGICRLVISNMPEEITGGSFGLQLGSRAAAGALVLRDAGGDAAGAGAPCCGCRARGWARRCARCATTPKRPT